MLLVTQDHYLFQGIKIFFPDIIQLSSVDRTIFDRGADEFSILIDSRSPLCFYEYLILDAIKARKRICCIILDMRHRDEHLLSSRWFWNISLTPSDMATLFNLFLDVKSKRLTREWFRNLRLSAQEHIMLRQLKAGITMEEIADELNTSVKSLYRKRIELYERLGLANFNEACLFIFRNKLLEHQDDNLYGLTEKRKRIEKIPEREQMNGKGRYR